MASNKDDGFKVNTNTFQAYFETPRLTTMQDISVRRKTTDTSRKSIIYDLVDANTGDSREYEVTDQALKLGTSEAAIISNIVGDFFTRQQQVQIGNRPPQLVPRPKNKTPKPVSDLFRNHEEACKEARSKGFEVVVGDEHTILLDLDNGIPPHFIKLLPEVHKQYTIVDQFSWISKSGLPHLHVVLKTAVAVPILERLGIQAVLGSDPIKELISIRRLREDGAEQRISVLFRPSKVEDVPTMETVEILNKLIAAGKSK